MHFSSITNSKIFHATIFLCCKKHFLKNFYFQTQKNGFMGPSLGPKEADSNPRNFDEDVLKAGQTVIGLQAGSNRGASQSGMNFGKTRSILDWLFHLCVVWIVRSTPAFYQPLLVPSEVNQKTISSVLAKPPPTLADLILNEGGVKRKRAMVHKWTFCKNWVSLPSSKFFR